MDARQLPLTAHSVDLYSGDHGDHAAMATVATVPQCHHDDHFTLSLHSSHYCKGQAHSTATPVYLENGVELEEGIRSFRTWCGLGRNWLGSFVGLGELELFLTLNLAW